MATYYKFPSLKGFDCGPDRHQTSRNEWALMFPSLKGFDCGPDFLDFAAVVGRLWFPSLKGFDCGPDMDEFRTNYQLLDEFPSLKGFDCGPDAQSHRVMRDAWVGFHPSKGSTAVRTQIEADNAGAERHVSIPQRVRLRSGLTYN